MNYIKVEWIHEKNEYPILLYSEISDDRYEVRKVESFSDGSLGYAYDGGANGSTLLGEVPLPTIEEIQEDSQFKTVEISKDEFEEIWLKAISI